MNETTLQRYARLIAVQGAGIQPDQDVVIQAGLDQPRFVELLVEECYLAGARKVTVDFHLQALDRLHTTHRSAQALGEMTDWEKARLEHYVNTLPCRIFLESDDPDGLKGIDQDKFTAAQQEKRRILKPYRDRMENRYQWCIAAVPGLAWAKKLFPGKSDDEALELLWQAILHAARADGDDPVAAWQAHNRDLTARCKHLNSLGITQLHYTASNGTDLTVGLMPESRFCGGGDVSLLGKAYNPNMPSEEVFTSPMRGKAEGLVCSTMPLSYQGQLIEDFSLRFENGRVTEHHARTNEALLGKMLSTDEGASQLGECALVPYDSPIQNAGLLFYNTLFDENASCHLALGAGYADTMEGFAHMTLDQCREKGLNDSLIHVDFMIGARDLSIDAQTADGKTVPIFRDGNWAF